MGQMYKKQIGVCIDNDVAYILEGRKDENLITIIDAEDVSTGPTQQKKRAFYKKVFELVQDFKIISLFASSKTRDEIVKQNQIQKLGHIVVEENKSDTVTERQKIAFIDNYFKAKAS